MDFRDELSEQFVSALLKRKNVSHRTDIVGRRVR